MRKILAGLMATAMVTSICATASMAATNKSAVIGFTNALSTAGTYDTIRLTLSPDATIDNADDIYVVAPLSITVPAGGTAVTVAKQLDGVKIGDIRIDGVTFSTKLKQVTDGDDLMTLTFSPAAKLPAVIAATSHYRIQVSSDGGATWSQAVVADSAIGAAAGTTLGEGGETIETEKGGDMSSANVSDIVVSYGDGSPVPLTDGGEGVDKPLNATDGVQSNNSVYFMIRDDEKALFDRMEDEDYFKLKIKKATNGKHIKAVSDVTKVFSGDLMDANTHQVVKGTGVTRHRYIKVELVENFTDDEIKLALDLTLSATQKAVDTKIVTTDSTSIKVKDFSFYMKNLVKSADNDWRVGISGLMLNPVQNDWNEVTYYDEDGDVAFMKFFGDSDVGKFYAKLSTKWAHEDYAAYFNDQDAFYFEFTGSPKLSSTSRADLQIYNPFVDEDGNETIDPSTATVYQVVDGDLIDVTDSFTYGEGTNGDDAFITRTRFLGSYIICEKPVEEAAGNADIEDIEPTTPDEVTPDTNNGGKNPANTGRYL